MTRSGYLCKEAKRHIPGGVNSPVRAFGAVGGHPRWIARGKDACVWDVDGNRYLDFVMSWGPLILGHANARVVRAIVNQTRKGTSYGAPSENELTLARLIKSAFPAIEKVRLVSSGTEAVMSAIRLARGATGKKKIVKCDGGYHGHADSLLVEAGSGAATFGVPNSAGVPVELAKLTISIPFNDIDALARTLKKHGSEVACFLLEPVPANMGVVLPKPDYLEQVRKFTTRYGVLLIFDEVVTGFRVAFGGAQERFGVRADLTCLGKVLGGGLPIGAFGGRAKWMNQLAPDGPVYQAGTLSGNPLATAAGIAALTQLSDKDFYRKLESKSEAFLAPLVSEIERRALPVVVNRLGSCFTIFFTRSSVTDYVTAKRCHTSRYGQFFHRLLDRGIYFTPSQFEANFISAAHKDADLEKAGKAVLKILQALSL